MNNDIFKQIKDTLDNYEIEPSKEVWQNIDSRIQKATRIQALRRVVVATIAIATVAAAIIYAAYNAHTHDTYMVQSHTNSSSNINNNTTTTTTTVPDTIPIVSSKAMPQTKACIENSKAMQATTTTNENTKTINTEPAEHITTNEANTSHSTTDNNNTTTTQQTQLPEPYINENPAPNNNEQSVAITLNSNSEATLYPTAEDQAEENINNLEQQTRKENSNMQQNNATKTDDTLYIPTGFTPDQPENNLFYVKGKNIKEYEIQIYSKQRVMVYNSKDINEKWDGRYNGEPLEMGAYVYMIVYTTTDNETHRKKGTITIIRNR